MACPRIKTTQLLPGLYRFEDTCNMYVVCGPHGCIAIDFGSGAWMKRAKRLGLPPLERGYMTCS
jgi:hypothetical protein